MKYIISESQLHNWLKRRLSPETYFAYIKKACDEYPDRDVDFEQFAQDVHTIAIDDFLMDEEGFVGEEELYEVYYDCLTNCFDGEIFEFIKNFYEEHMIE